jgi:hypothetical protein
MNYSTSAGSPCGNVNPPKIIHGTPTRADFKKRHQAVSHPVGSGLVVPARPGRETGILRLGLAIPGASATLPLTPGHHLLTDPDGRTIASHST